ncbi:MAG: hypothetical protein DHS20C06_16990 [Hyphobacterium sp.]|nr:MAG: hypothetical protein DHS20C06_16990 [Hyphobacterium sp.]
MAKPGSSNPATIIGLSIAVTVFAVTVFLNQSQSSSSLIMPMAEQGDASSNSIAASLPVK